MSKGTEVDRIKAIGFVEQAATVMADQPEAAGEDVLHAPSHIIADRVANPTPPGVSNRRTAVVARDRVQLWSRLPSVSVQSNKKANQFVF
jgi:hypothetical protein